MKRYCGSIGVRIKSLLVLTAVFAVASALFASFASAGKGPTSVNNGGGTPSCGKSCDSSGNQNDSHQSCNQDTHYNTIKLQYNNNQNDNNGCQPCDVHSNTVNLRYGDHSNDNNGCQPCDVHSNTVNLRYGGNNDNNGCQPCDVHSNTVNLRYGGNNDNNGCQPCDVHSNTVNLRYGGNNDNNGCPPPKALPKVFLGYADTYGPRLPGAYPSPWQGSAGVIFVGCGTSPIGGGPAADTCPQETTGGDSYDAGAIRIDNSSATTSMPVTGGSVKIGSCTYNPWPGLSVTIPPGGTLILTQTGLTGDPCGQNLGGNYNFDTSESSGNGNCTPSGAIPVITLTINGSPTTINDTGQILNKKGIDTGACNTGVNESAPWVQVL